MYNTIKNKKLAELTSVFFDKNCFKMYIIPPFYNKKFDQRDKPIRYAYYGKHAKDLSVMTGTIATIINYLSKSFNITLKYPLFISGSRSFIFKDKKE